MKYLAKFLLCVKTDPFLFSKKDVNYIIGLTSTQIKDLKKYALENELIIYSKHQYNLTDKGVDLLNKTPADSWGNDINYPKRPKINLEYLKEEKAPANLTKAIRNLARHLLKNQELKEYSIEWGLKQELLSDNTNCKELKKEIIDFLSKNNRVKLIDLYNYFQSEGITKSIISILLLDVLSEYREEFAIYENLQFQLKLDQLMFDRMMCRPQNFELQKTLFKHYLILDKISEFLLPRKDKNILNITKGLIHFIRSLDKYTMQTERLSKQTIRFRNIIVNSKDPIKLFEQDIPRVLNGTELKDCDNKFADAFENAIQELQQATSKLEKELFKFTLSTFKSQNREELLKRAEKAKEFIGEKELKILCNNIVETESTDSLWIQRIATFINKSRVPKDWSDFDVADFKVKIKELALKFMTIESTIGTTNVIQTDSFNKLLNSVLMLSKAEKNILLRKVVNG